MNEPVITCRPDAGRLPATACYAYSPWERFPVIGPALTVLIAILGALALVSNANAFNDVNAELQIAAREQRLAKAEAERVARAQAARRAALLASATPAKAAGAAPEPPTATPAPARKEPRPQ